jgi:hypothetical protein
LLGEDINKPKSSTTVKAYIRGQTLFFHEYVSQQKNSRPKDYLCRINEIVDNQNYTFKKEARYIVK